MSKIFPWSSVIGNYKSGIHFLFLVILGWFITNHLFAQSNIRLSGRIFDGDTGSPISGAFVQIPGTIYGAVADNNGEFLMENIPGGKYAIHFSRLGYKNLIQTGVTISQETVRHLTVSLTPVAIEIDSIIVTANSANELPGVEGRKIVLTRENIEKYQGLGLRQLLQQAAGVQVETGGGGSSRTIIRLHGSRSNQVLVLLDGQRLNDPQTGEIDLNEIPLEQIEKIEIIPHGNSALFGGSAFAGVIDFKTRSALQQNYAGIKTQAGSWETANGIISMGASLKSIGLISNYQQEYSRQNFDYTYQGETLVRKNAWYRNQKIFFKLGFASPKHQANVMFNYRNSEQGLPSAFFNELNHFDAFREGSGQALQANYRWTGSAKGFIEGKFAYHQLDRLFNNQNEPSLFTRYKIRQTDKTYEPKLTAFYKPNAAMEMRLGFHYIEEQLLHENILLPSLSIGKKRRHTTARYASFEYELSSLKSIFKTTAFRSALRFEKYFDHAGEWFPLAGISLVPQLLPMFSFSASWAKAIRYPDFNSLFWKGDARARGNPDLLPERKKLWNINLRLTPNHLFLPHISAYYYSEDITDLIIWHRTQNGAWEPRNEARVDKQGLDLQIQQNIVPRRLQLNASYSFIDALNRSNEPNRKDKRIVFIPRHTVNTAVWASVGPIQSQLIFRYVSEREVVAANTANPLPIYRLWDFSVSWQKSLKNFQADLGLTLENFTSEDYQLIRGFPMPGREFKITAKFAYRKKPTSQIDSN